jgi:hypothetical protein
MTVATVRARHDSSGSSPAADDRMAGDLEVPRPLRLLLTAGWNLSESVGLPVAAYVAAAWLDGRNAGLIAGLAAIWLTAVIRKVVTGTVPSLLTISVVVLTVQTAVVLATGELWLFLLLTAGLAVLMVTEPTKTFLMLSTAATAALVVAGTGASTLWFLSVLRRLGLRLRFAPA